MNEAMHDTPAGQTHAKVVLKVDRVTEKFRHRYEGGTGNVAGG